MLQLPQALHPVLELYCVQPLMEGEVLLANDLSRYRYCVLVCTSTSPEEDCGVVVQDDQSDHLQAGCTGAVTVTVQDAVFPLFDLAVIVAVPAALAVTVPLLTVATPLLLLLHVTVLLGAFDGLIVAVRVEEDPAVRDRLVRFRAMPVTATAGGVSDAFRKSGMPQP